MRLGLERFFGRVYFTEKECEEIVCVVLTGFIRLRIGSNNGKL
jgi:hypothetical protein